MNLIQRGTTASRANRGKSVKKSIAQYNGSERYVRNAGLAGFIVEDFVAGIP
jgi:hypothetical protein